MDLTALLESAGLSPAATALAVPAVLYALAWLAAALPRPAEGSRLAPLRRLLDVLAANVGQARNAPPVPRPGGVPGLVLALLLGASTMACATTEDGQAVQVSAARTTLLIAGAALAARADDLPPEVVAGLHVALGAAAEAVAAWDAAPADSAAAQLGAARLALLLAGMRAAQVSLADG